MNVLAVGAHYDDIELGCSGALRKHVNNGDKVYIYVATTSGFINPDGKVVRANSTAEVEGEEAARIIGAELIKGEFATLNLEFVDDLSVSLIKIIEDKKIDLIYTHYDNDVHHDHIALAKATLHAGRHVPRILQYHSNWYKGNMGFSPDFFVDISEIWDVKENAIKAHKTEYERSGKQWLDFFHNEAINNGMMCGVKLAEGFQVVKWLC